MQGAWRPLSRRELAFVHCSKASYTWGKERAIEKGSRSNLHTLGKHHLHFSSIGVLFGCFGRNSTPTRRKKKLRRFSCLPLLPPCLVQIASRKEASGVPRVNPKALSYLLPFGIPEVNDLLQMARLEGPYGSVFSKVGAERLSFCFSH